MVNTPIAHISIENDRSAKRLAICEGCPLFTNDPIKGYICDNTKLVDIDGNLTTTKSIGSKSGCGCRLKAKTRIISESCILGKW